MFQRIANAALAASALLLVGCTSNSIESVDSTGSTATSLPTGATSVASGSFSGRNDHIVTGGVQVMNADGKSYVVLADSFSLDGAPDPKIGFGTDGEYDKETTFTVLDNITGEQTYLIPSSVDTSAFNEVYIWCDQFSVALGIASLR